MAGVRSSVHWEQGVTAVAGTRRLLFTMWNATRDVLTALERTMP